MYYLYYVVFEIYYMYYFFMESSLITYSIVSLSFIFGCLVKDDVIIISMFSNNSFMISLIESHLRYHMMFLLIYISHRQGFGAGTLGAHLFFWNPGLRN